MKMKTSVSLVIALVLGLITAKVGLDLMKNYRGGTPLTSRVVLSKRTMIPGHVIKAEDVETKVVAVDLVPANALHDPKEVIGRTANASIAVGQTMLEAMLIDKNAGSGLAAVLKPGMREVTVDVSDSSAVAGMLDRGSKVDVIATLRKGDQTIAKAVVENVEVQSLQRAVSGYTRKDGQTTAIENGAVKSVTLLVTPRQASALELANAGGGRPRLVLRGNGDITSSDGQMSDDELVGIEPEPKPEPVAATDDTFENVPPPQEDKGRPVEIIRGGTTSTIYIDETNQEEGTESKTASAKLNPAGSNARESGAPKRRASQR